MINDMDKALLKKNIAKYYPLYEVHSSRLKRLLHSPFHTGFFYIQNFFAHLRPYRVTKLMPWGALMSFYLPEGNQIYYYDFWEINLTNFVIDFLEPGDTFVDIGSHVGYYASLAAALVGPNGTVLAVEPTPRTFENLAKNLSTFPNGIAYNAALTNQEGVLPFYDYGPALSAFNSFTKREALGDTKLEPKEIQIPAVTLDYILDKYAPRAALIKIDAEGAESAILSGASNTLKTLRPVISIEVGGYEAWKSSTSEALRILKDNQYLMYEVQTSGLLIPYETTTVFGYDNLVAVPTEKTSWYQRLMSSAKQIS